MLEKLSANIVSAEKVVLQEDVLSIIVPGMLGDFMVLPNHGDSISSLRPGYLESVTEKNKKIKLFVSGGIIEVFNNKVSILVDSYYEGDEINLTTISKYIKDLEALDMESIENKDDHELRLSDFNEVKKILQNK